MTIWEKLLDSQPGEGVPNWSANKCRLVNPTYTGVRTNNSLWLDDSSGLHGVTLKDTSLTYINDHGRLYNNYVWYQLGNARNDVRVSRILNKVNLIMCPNGIEGVIKPGDTRDRQVTIRLEATPFTNMNIIAGNTAVVPVDWVPINKPKAWTFCTRVVRKDWVYYKLSSVSVSSAVNNILAISQYTAGTSQRWIFGDASYRHSEMPACYM
jgi:hypothetical protein